MVLRVSSRRLRWFFSIYRGFHIWKLLFIFVMEKVKFDVIHMQEAIDFLHEIDEKARAKIARNIILAKQKLDPRLFKKIDEVFWEFRTEYNGIQYRLLAFWHRRNGQLALVITTHGFVKKTDKIPTKELRIAYERRKKYLNNEKETDR
jgi:phage-related protein